MYSEKSTKKVVKEKIELELRDIVNKIYDSLPSYMKHVCNIIHQYQSIFDLKKPWQSKKFMSILVKITNANTQKKYRV